MGGTSPFPPRPRPWVRRGRGLRPLRPPLPLTCGSTGAAFVPPENRRETQLKSWRQMGGNPTWSCSLNSILGEAAFVKQRTMARSVRGAALVSTFGARTPDTWPPLCRGPGQTFYLEAFLNLSGGRNVTHGPAASPEISRSLKNFWAHIPKAD